jgi:hypothetical protein
MQAIGIIKKYEDEVSSLTSSLNIHEEDFECWIEEEKHFLMDLKDEPVEHVVRNHNSVGVKRPYLHELSFDHSHYGVA